MMRLYGFGVVGLEGALPWESAVHPFEDEAQKIADEANKSTDEFYSNRVPWVVVPLFFEEKEE